MQGHPDVIEALNRALTIELTAVRDTLESWQPYRFDIAHFADGGFDYGFDYLFDGSV